MLFDKNGFYLIPSQKDGYDFAVDIMNADFDKVKMYSLEEALRKGNLFPKLYEQYKDYEPRPICVDTQREKMLLKIQELDFSINDLNLYLDLYPDDRYAYSVFKSYVKEYKRLKEEYAKVFGPLTLDETTDDYEWSKGVWPWEEGGM